MLTEAGPALGSRIGILKIKADEQKKGNSSLIAKSTAGLLEGIVGYSAKLKRENTHYSILEEIWIFYIL